MGHDNELRPRHEITFTMKNLTALTILGCLVLAAQAKPSPSPEAQPSPDAKPAPKPDADPGYGSFGYGYVQSYPSHGYHGGYSPLGYSGHGGYGYGYGYPVGHGYGSLGHGFGGHGFGHGHGPYDHGAHGHVYVNHYGHHGHGHYQPNTRQPLQTVLQALPPSLRGSTAMSRSLALDESVSHSEILGNCWPQLSVIIYTARHGRENLDPKLNLKNLI